MSHRLEVYTVQMARWKKVNNAGVPLYNTTVKNGLRAFCPTWDMVLGYKAGKITADQYTEQYNAMMHASLEKNVDAWDELLSQHVVALSCFCPAGVFCHRHLLKLIVKEECEKRGIEFVDLGEFR